MTNTIHNAQLDYDRYLRIDEWAARRYEKNGVLISHVGGKPTAYGRIRELAFKRYALGRS